MLFPAGAGVIPNFRHFLLRRKTVPRRRGGDPEAYIESQPVAGDLEIGDDGNFAYLNDTASLYGSAEISGGSFSGSFSVENGSSRILRPNGEIPVTSNAEAIRFAKGLLRNANKWAQRGTFARSLMTGYAAASLLRIKTTKASAWNGTIFVNKIRHDYVANATIFYFRKERSKH